MSSQVPEGLIVPQDADPSSGRGWRSLRGRTKALTVGLVLLILAFAASLLIHVPYVIFKPGPAPNTLGKLDGKKIIEVSGAKTYPTSGALHFTTVSMYGGPGDRPSLLEYAMAKMSDDVEIYPESKIFPKTATQKQVQQENQLEMTGSQSAAEVVAAKQAGYTVPMTIEVGGIEKGVEAAKVLKVGDVIRSINGSTIKDSASVQASMKKVKPGDQVSLGITRGGKNQDVKVSTHNVNSRAVMGIELMTVPKMPFKVNVAVGDVGGPSAGMMFTLAIYDELTPGALTGGKDIAGTGTMDVDGNVGPIGGIREKVVGAHNSGAKFFLAPSSNCAELKGHVPGGLNVFSVGTISDAIKVVKGIASGSTSSFAHCG